MGQESDFQKSAATARMITWIVLWSPYTQSDTILPVFTSQSQVFQYFADIFAVYFHALDIKQAK